MANTRQKLEWTQSNAQQNLEQLQNPIMGITIANDSTKSRTTVLVLTTAKATGGVKCILLVQIMAIDSAVVEAIKMISLHG